DYEGDLFDSGDVHSFMERTGLHPTLPDAGQADEVFFSLRPFGHQCAHCDRNHRAEMTDHGELILLWAAPLNVPDTPPHWAQARAKIRARNVDQRFAECGSPCLVANQWREDVVFLQKQTASHADRFLAFPYVNSTSYQTAAIKTNELFFKRARQQHPTKCLEKALMRRCGLSCFRSCAALRRLKHRTILRKIDKRAQRIFVALATSILDGAQTANP